jgi:L-ascorbate metabolism protein UlaG (beta-lactamase superfamily)
MAPGAAVAQQRDSGTTLTYLGTAGWQLTDGAAVILIDPYLSRIKGPGPTGNALIRQSPGDDRPVYELDDAAPPDTAVIDAHIQKADYILVTHAHFDHVLDVPYIAAKTRATVVGTASTINILRAHRVPDEQLIAVHGGEDFEFGAFSLRVIPSLHSPLNSKHYFSDATAPAGMQAPLTLRQMHPEGGTLAYLVRIDGLQILCFGGMNYIERELQGLEPDVAIVGAAASRKEIHDYGGRLMRVLDNPPLVLPTHWDNFLVPYEAPQQEALDALQVFVEEIRLASPRTRVEIPRYFEPIPVAKRRR